MATLQEALLAALDHHQSGRTAEAEILYGRILEVAPDLPDALHLYGVLAGQTGRLELAADLIGRATRNNGAVPDYHANLGNALNALGRTTEAADAYRRALDLAPERTETRYALALIEMGSNAETSAAEHLERVAVERPDLAAAHGHLGMIRQAQGRHAEAEAAFSAALARDPAQAAVRRHRAALRRHTERTEGALADLRIALALEPGEAGDWNELGTVLKKLGRLREAVAAYGRAAALRPDAGVPLANRAETSLKLGDLDAAADDARAAIARQAGLAEAHNTLGAVLVAQGHPENAVAAFRAALDLDPDHRMAQFNLALALLATGRFAEGWDAYEHGWGVPGGRSPERGFPQPPWQGTVPDDGGKLLVWGEQGLGDEVMYATVVPQLAAEGIACVLECDARLAPLFARSLDGVEVVARRESQDPRLFAPDIAAQVPSGSLPRHRRRDAASFAAGRPAFLRPDGERAAALRARHHDGRLLLGISWHSKNPGVGRVKSMTLDLLAGALARDGVKLVNLQYGDVAADVAALRAARGIGVHVDPEVDTWSDIDGLTALIEAMDLVVSVGNVTVHLAGAIGKPLWALLPYAADWRWTRGHDHALWYPSVRLFRQPAPGDWEGVLDGVGRALDARVACHRQRG